MSVVVYRNGVLAADSRAYGGRGQASPGRKNKIHDLGDGRRVGVVSAVLGDPERFVAWLRKGADPTAWVGEKPDIRALLIDAGGDVYLYDESIWPSGPITPGECVAIGSGSDYAMGAMHMGATASQAVEAAIRFESNCGGPIVILSAGGALIEVDAQAA